MKPKKSEQVKKADRRFMLIVFGGIALVGFILHTLFGFDLGGVDDNANRCRNLYKTEYEFRGTPSDMGETAYVKNCVGPNRY